MANPVLVGFDKARFDELVETASAALRTHQDAMVAHDKTGKALNDAYDAWLAAQKRLSCEVESMVRRTVEIAAASRRDS